MERVEVVGHEIERRAAPVDRRVGIDHEHQVRATAHLELGDAVVGLGIARRPQAERPVEVERSMQVVRCEHDVPDPERRTFVGVHTSPTTCEL